MGVQLSATLLLPPEYREGERLPVVVWAYPREYSNAAVGVRFEATPTGSPVSVVIPTCSF